MTEIPTYEELLGKLEELQESLNSYRTFVDNIQDLFYRTDLEGRISYISPSVYSLSGYTVDEAIGMHMAEEVYLHPEERNEFLAKLRDKGQVSNFEARLKRKDGSVWWASTNAHFYKDSEGHILGVEGITRDITDLKQAMEALQSSEQKYRFLAEEAPMGILTCNAEGQIDYVNGQMLEILGSPGKDQTIHINLLHFPPLKEAGFSNLLEQCLERGESQKTELKYISKWGKALWAIVQIAPLKKNSMIRGALIIATDISDRKLMEDQLRQTQKIEAIGNLAGGIAHDFNNLLFPIIGMSEMLMDDFTPGSPEYECIQEIYKAGQRGSKLVKQILEFSRQTEQQKLPTRIQQVLKEALKLSRSTIPANINITHDLQSDCGLVMADPTQIQQITMNLITNAYHATEKTGGEISVRLEEIFLTDEDKKSLYLEPGRYALLTVSDTGCGIDSAVVDHIFEPYFTTKEQGKGTGLGLAVVYGIVKELGGDVFVQSELDKGTTFNVFIPSMVNLDEMASASSTLVTTPTGNERILILDDEESVVQSWQKTLERLGYTIVSRTSSPDALKAFNVSPDKFDLVITDMAMPNMTGEEFAKELISIRPDIPIILCTGFSERLNDEKAKSIGIKGFLMKPVVRSEMANMIRKVLDEANLSVSG